MSFWRRRISHHWRRRRELKDAPVAQLLADSLLPLPGLVASANGAT
jgi:hypothetical protein